MIEYHDIQSLKLPTYLEATARKERVSPLLVRMQTTSQDDLAHLMEDLFPWWKNECGSCATYYLSVRDTVNWLAWSKEGDTVSISAYKRQKARKAEYRISMIYGFNLSSIGLLTGSPLTPVQNPHIEWNATRIYTHVNRPHTYGEHNLDKAKKAVYQLGIDHINRYPNIISSIMTLGSSVENVPAIILQLEKIFPKMSYEECEIVAHASLGSLTDENSEPIRLIKTYSDISYGILSSLRRAADKFYQKELDGIHLPGV